MPNQYKKLINKLSSEVTVVPSFMQQAYYRSLDGFRGVAIIMVVAGHIGLNHYVRPTGLYIDSRLGVNLFFVLSGFLNSTPKGEDQYRRCIFTIFLYQANIEDHSRGLFVSSCTPGT